MKKFNSTFTFITIVVVFTTITNAQYKLNIGNFWVYSNDTQEWKITIVDTATLFDSVLYYKTHEQKEWLSKSNYNVLENGDTNQYFIRKREDDLFEELIIYNAIQDTVFKPFSYKENARLGDKWISYFHDSTKTDTIWAEVEAVFEGYQFGEWRTIKKIHSIASSPQIVLGADSYFCDDFGELSIVHNIEILSSLKGCYIDGVAYGDTIFTTVAVQEAENLTNNYQLEQNYPNPFNPSTIISYSIPQSGFVQLTVYDLLGREVASLVNKEQAIGNYKVEFNALILTSGVYFYKIESGDFMKVNKMLLLR